VEFCFLASDGGEVFGDGHEGGPSLLFCARLGLHAAGAEDSL
jgi:hypothetical protein